MSGLKSALQDSNATLQPLIFPFRLWATAARRPAARSRPLTYPVQQRFWSQTAAGVQTRRLLRLYNSSRVGRAFGKDLCCRFPAARLVRGLYWKSVVAEYRGGNSRPGVLGA